MQIEKDLKIFRNKMIFLLFITLAIMIFSLFIGRIWFNPLDYFHYLYENEPITNIIINIRLPRILANIFVGASLSIAGLVFQNVFKNPLVGPSLLGVSSGASVGAAIAIIFEFNLIYIQAFSFLAGLISVFIVLAIYNMFNNKTLIILILSGIIINGLMSSILGLIKYMANPETQLQDIVFWQLGTFSKINFEQIKYVLPCMIVSLLVIFVLKWRLNLVSLDEDEAKNLGLNIVRERIILILFATLLTASSVCLTGIIGWVGLIIPHIARMIVDWNNQKLVPVTLFLGSIFLLVTDNVSRTLSQQEIPIGIITGFIGAPIFFWILIKKWKKANE